MDDALDVTPEEREALLAALAARDPVLARDVRTLLREHDAAAAVGFLDAPIGPPPGVAAAVASLAAEVPAASLAGQVLGAYTLLSPIGQGGMGAVWLAVRSDGRYEGQAAVKLLNASLMGPPGDQRDGRDRFTREGTILARLRHPSIAQLIDAGVSPVGQPYLVLEYVLGAPIDRFCDDRRLGVEARLRLFLEVLAAVAYAHANLIVHRDIKPSNVLVRTDAGVEHGAQRVKLLDFGIAKLLEPDAIGGVGVVETRDSGWALTPAFAAPEQLTGQPVTTGTDVYSLGVLLYLLLTGQHPVGAGLRSPAGLIAAVVDTEAPRLSTAVTDAKAQGPDALATHAANRAATPIQLRHALAGDLDTIVAKALKKAPGERYASVEALADDLRRVLDQRPVSVRPDTLRYRASKFVRRHRVPVALAALAAVALAAGVAGTVTQAGRATRHAARADQEALTARTQRDFALAQVSRAETINDLNAFLLVESASRPAPLTAIGLLSHAEQIVQRQRETNENRVEMLVSIGTQYDVLGHREKARDLLTQAYHLSRPLADHGTRAVAACGLAPILAKAGESDRAEQLLQEASSALPEEPQYALHRVTCGLQGAIVAMVGARGEAAIERVRTAQAVLKASGLTSPVMEFQIAMALAEGYSHARRSQDALAAFAEASRQLTTLGRDESLKAYYVSYNWGVALQLLGRPLEAAPLLLRAQGLTTRNVAGDAAVHRLGLALARAEAELHRWPEAAGHAARAYAEARRLGDDGTAANVRLLQAAIARQRGDLAGAAGLLADVAPRLAGLKASPHAGSPGATFAAEQAALAQARGDARGGLALIDRAIALSDAGPRAALARFLVRRSQIALQLDRVPQAQADAARALALDRQALEPGSRSSSLGRAHLALGRALLAAGQRPEARTELSAAVEHLTIALGADHPETREAKQPAAAETATP